MKKFLAAFLLAAFVCTAMVLVTGIRLKSPGSPLFATIGGAEKQIANSALAAWILAQGETLVYSEQDGNRGYEGEGQSLYAYEASTGRSHKVLSASYRITAVQETKSNSGRIAWLVNMVDGGLGASHVAVLDPSRGEMFAADGARFISKDKGSLTVAWYRDDDWDNLQNNLKVKPLRTKRYDIDELLKRPTRVKPAS